MRSRRTPSGSSPSPYYYDAAAADKAAQFFPELLRHVKGEWAGQPLVLEEWQTREIVQPLFGWKRRSDDTRRYRTAYIEVPRKNGKSTLAAGIALYLLFADGEAGAEVYSAAADREQAAIVFDVARSMVDASPELAKRSQRYRRSIVYGDRSYKVLSADAFTKHGVNAHGIIFDELHAQPNRELYDVLHTSTGARRQPLEFLITTAGIYDPASICWELHDYALKVRDGIIHDDSLLPVIYAADKDDDWTDSGVWAKANPGLGVIVKADYLGRECEKARQIAAYQNTFRRLHLNQWTEQVKRWIDMALWEENSGLVDEAALVGRECYSGLDLSSTTDLSALVHVFPPVNAGEKWRALCRFFVPGENIARRARQDRVPYDAWVRDGWIDATPGDVIDYDVIRARVNQDGKQFQIRELVIDRWNATQLATQLEGDGFTVALFGQGFASMSAPTKELLKILLARALDHGGNPVLRWMAANVAVKEDAAGNLKPDKSKSSGRIDGIVALVMGIGRGSLFVPSVYSERGLIVL